MAPSTKPTTRLSSAFVRDRGLRQSETMSIDAIYSFALKARLAREKFEKQKARKAKRNPT